MHKTISEIFRKDTTRIKSIALHPKQPVFITGNHCGMIYLWDLNFLAIIGSLKRHIGSVRSVSFHSSGELFASCGDDKIIRVWNYKTRTVMMEFKSHTHTVRSVSFHPTNPWVVSGSDDYTVKIWNYHTGEMLSSSSGHNHYIMSVLFLDSMSVVSGSLDQMIYTWTINSSFETESKKIIDKINKMITPNVILDKTIDAHDKGVNCLYMKGNALFSGGDDQEIKVWKVCDNDLVFQNSLYLDKGNITSVCYDDGELIGVTESGYLVVSKERKNRSTIYTGSRLWAVNANKHYVLVGSDDGLIIYRRGNDLIGAMRGDNVLYINDGVMAFYESASNKTRELARIRDQVCRLIPGKNGCIILEYESQYELFGPNGVECKKYGQCGYVDDDMYELREGVLFKNGTSVAKNVHGILFCTAMGVFIVDGKKIIFRERTINLAYIPCSVVACAEEVAFVGKDRILIYDRSMRLKVSVHENVEITGGVYVNGSDGLRFFVYVTMRNIKYVYGESGVLLSVDEYQKPLGMLNNELYLLGRSGIRRALLKMNEIKFRKVVDENNDILGFIEKNSLPGISPLNYLVKKGKGAVALPYIKDDATRFELYLSSGKFFKAYELCTTETMCRDLAFEAMKRDDYEMAEKCFQEIGDEKNMFYLYLCTNQIAKIGDLKSETLLTGIVLEDQSLLNDYFGYKLFEAESIENQINKMKIDKE